ncbi:hypothetical protein HID58_095252 [Brassica napus]|uniref:Xyloglucan endotransglucosylase/hydrolase n=1 Tax=Brassica napus TaxID=3708 RepID=A0ABQ7X5W1_BRANA|nr:hypothetical protein HID58_095252 [Brassica napus]
MMAKTHFLCIVTLCTLMFIKISARPTTFAEDFKAAWSGSHIRQVDGGKAIQLVLDQSTGCGFSSKEKSNSFSFPRLCRYGHRLLLATLLGANKHICSWQRRDRTKVNLWFDPSLDFHTYSILWSHKHIVFYVDDVPIREYKNNQAKNIAYPTSQPMEFTHTMEADDWATRGGLEKIDWSKAPFYAYYKDFDIEGCPVPGPTNCPSNPHNWWEGYAYQSLNAVEARRYRWVRVNHMVYDYCTDKSRYPVPPIECHA